MLTKPFYKKPVTWILATLVTTIVVTGILLFKKYRASQKLVVGYDGFEAEKFTATQIPQIISGGLNAKIDILIKNFSPSIFNITQVKIDVYTTDGVLIASLNKPLSTPVKITANANSKMALDYNIDKAGLIALFTDSHLLQSLGSYLLNGKFGEKIVLKGFVIADGLEVNINETVEI